MTGGDGATGGPAERCAVGEDRVPAGPGVSLPELVGRALTGEGLGLDESMAIGQIAAGVRRAGWDGARISALRDRRRLAGLPWPIPVPAAQRGTIGAAQLLSAAQLVARQLGVQAPTRVRDARMPLSSRDAALIADRPPHHGT